MSRTVIKSQANRPDAPQPGTVYLIYDDDHVIAYGRETDGRRPALWIASLWRGHPLDDAEAVHVEHLAADSTWRELHDNIRSWEGGRWPL